MNSQKNYKSAFIIVTSLFFLWGFITVLVDSLVPRLRDLFGLSYFEAGLVQFSFFIAYFLLSIPSSYALSRLGYKKSIILGLSVMALGCVLLYPASSLRLLELFWGSVFVLAAGMSLMQVTANPYVTLLGSKEGASSRLSLAQAFNSVGATLAPMIGAIFILSERALSQTEIDTMLPADRQLYLAEEAASIQFPFMVMAAVLVGLSLLFTLVRLPDVSSNPTPSLASYRNLFSEKNIIYGSIAIFLYVGVEVAIGSYLINYFIEMNIAKNILESPAMLSVLATLSSVFGTSDISMSDPKAIVGAFVTFYWGGAMVGRFSGAMLTRVVRPAIVLSVFASIAIVLVLISINSSGLISMWTILAVGFFNSIMFPMIFLLSTQSLPNNMCSQASGILCTMIVGGAVIPPLFGYFIDHIGFNLAFLTFIVCYVYILFYGYFQSGRTDIERTY